MQQEEKNISLQTLKDIHGIMERSSRFLSLSGWSGVWAGCTALAGALAARAMLLQLHDSYRDYYHQTVSIDKTAPEYRQVVMNFVWLALGVLFVALAGGVYFTWKKAKKEGATIWNNASKKMVAELLIPLLAGGVFATAFLIEGLELYIPAICLAFYGLGLINGSKYTRSDIKYLGMLEVALGCVSLFVRGYGLLLWTIGFGILHILYGIIMWRKYDKA
ncbi:MAG: hypothetical protein JST82_15420 [Bacteroidetes bacterium]|nr:hypothetical protein [Bacteroidota bacterium]